MDHSFLWGYLLAFVPTHTLPTGVPCGWDVARAAVQNCLDCELRYTHKIELMKLFQCYVRTFKDHECFKTTVSESLALVLSELRRDEELTAAFDLATALSDHSSVASLALDILRRTEIAAGPPVEKAIVYLSENLDPALLRPALVYLFRLLRSDVANNFLYHAVSKLMDAMLEKSSEERPLVAATQHLVAFVWNRKGQNCPRLKRAFLLELAAKTGAVATFPGWSQFVPAVLQPYHHGQPFSWDFSIPEKEMHPDFAKALEEDGDLSACWKAKSPRRRSGACALRTLPIGSPCKGTGGRVRPRPRRGSTKDKMCSVV
jgi:hypothetical protein